MLLQLRKKLRESILLYVIYPRKRTSIKQTGLKLFDAMTKADAKNKAKATKAYAKALAKTRAAAAKAL